MLPLLLAALMLPLAAPVLSGCSGAPEPQSSEATASKSAAVGDAVDDTGHNAVGWIATSDSQCTAVLLTPRWVATAAHCVLPHITSWQCLAPNPSLTGGDHRHDNVTVSFGEYRSSPMLTVQHRYDLSGPILTRPGGAFSVCTNDGAAVDLALIKLDKRVDPSVIPPMHPPINGVAGCVSELATRGGDSNNFEGVLLGYGSRSACYLFGCDFGQIINTRGLVVSENWDNEAMSPSGEFVYRNHWCFTAYHGGRSGDSGGPLLTTHTQTGEEYLCGINSRYYPFSADCSAYADAALDSPNNKHFMEQSGLVDGNGNFAGECVDDCPGQDADLDSDNDTVPDCCDNCPHKKNLDQADGDGDGIGDVCDACPDNAGNFRDPAIANVNYEAEKGLKAQGYPITYRADVCDPTPVAKFRNVTDEALADYDTSSTVSPGLVGPKGALPPGTYIKKVVTPPPPLCRIFHCRAVGVGVKNRIDVDGIDLPYAGQGKYGFSHCDCTGNDPSTRQSREQTCDGYPHYCNPRDTFTFLHPVNLDVWNRVPSRRADETWAQGNTGEAFTSEFAGYGDEYPDAHLYWDFTHLSYAKGVAAGDPSVTGVLWSHVYEHPAFNGPDAVSSDPASYYYDGSASLQMVGGGGSTLWLYVPHPLFQLPAPCRTCTLEEGDMLVIPGALTGGATALAEPQGTRWVIPQDLPLDVTTLAASVDSGMLRVFRASESWFTLEDAGTSLRGVALDQYNRPVTSIALDALGKITAPPIGREFPGLASSEVTFSALHGGRLFIYGDNEPQVTVRTLSGFDQVFPLDAGARPQKVLASTWRDQWGSIFAIDRAGARTRLVRWEYGTSHFDVVAEWPSAFSRQWHFWLNTMPGGDLLLTASRKHGRFTVLTRLGVEAPGKLALRGIRVVHERVVARPAVDYTRAQMLVLGRQLPYRTVHVDSFTLHSGPWAPILKVHHGHHGRRHGHHGHHGAAVGPDGQHHAGYHTTAHGGWHGP